MVAANTLPTKYCKYFLFNRCKSSLCNHTHRIQEAQVMSCRKMNASNADLDRVLKTIKANPQIEHINFGRNRVSKKQANEIAQILSSTTHRIKSLCLDSTCLGRSGFITIMRAAAHSPHLTYLDVADTRFVSNNSPRNSPNSHAANTPCLDMMEYQREKAIECILELLASPTSSLQHLILGHNALSESECERIVHYAAKRGLVTLDLGGNDIDDETLNVAHSLLLEHRRKCTRQQLWKQKQIPQCISSLILEFTVSENDCLYRCYKWRPRIK
eukprot:CAMPEP_0202695670 /NCGR_PEP_ID=MMETSP1385-20130828/9216_1 /ASSEMBLY_ACC=CAM_ASM_000861 /TAXON_ID=933848 /ORGANISM="Elphidium margaritaceum" /LENGTH=271 /DNA_ID=CAMNT_0049351741 /DNA_START=54 /DNA_END=869 /DNA_ORIENTATION=-